MFIKRFTIIFLIWISVLTVSYSQSPDYNYIKSTELLIPITDPDQIDGLDDGEKMDVIQYYDGLGRLIQTNSYHTSPTYRDIVQHTEYDPYGRQIFDLLPFTIKGADGRYLDNGYDLTIDYYASPSDPSIPSSEFPFGEREFDNSPLNRVMKQGFPDSSWQLNAHPRQFNYLSNSSSDQVRLFEYDEATAQFSSSGNYNVHTLYVDVAYDENGNQSRTFTDKSGKVVLKETSLSGTKLRTYYIYDVYDNLVVVIQPEGSSQVSGSFSSTTQFIDRWCFTYRYDDRQRLVEKKIPGMNKPVYMVYDSLDRLILTQDGNLKSSDLYDRHWYFTKYDALGRPVIEGLYRNRADTAREEMQSAVDDYMAQHSYFESRSGTQFATRQGYTDNAFPPLDSCEILKVYYYDDYDFDRDSQEDYSYHELTGFVDLDYLDFPKGMLTGTRFKILIEPLLQDPFLFSVNFYDKKSRVIQQQSRNHSGHFDTLTTKYNFVGDPVLSRYSFSGTQECHVVYDSMEYDHARRLKKVHKKIDDQSWFQMAEMNYNELGQLIEKNLHRTSPSAFLQSLDFSYNIRGWLYGINLRNNGNDNKDLFFQQLLYDSAITTLQSTPQYNGNIAAEIWWHYGNTSNKGYGYTYDQASRLTKAIYGTSTANAWTASGQYSLPLIAYDQNGNITELYKHAPNGQSYTLIDLLAYWYNGNQVIRINDPVNTYVGFKDNGHVSGTEIEYSYDNNGNMIKDLNKGITSIVYNHLNLPCKIEFENNKRITYLYDALGNKLRKCYYEDNHLMETTDYYGMFVAKDDHVDHILTTEGRLKYNENDHLFYAEYFIKDHLGNVRDVVTTDPDFLNSNTQITDYYPFGQEIPISSSSDNQLKYNGKELQDEAKLNWYDYGFRFYDPVIARWHVPDPKAEKYFDYSPYNYALNNPLYFVDPMGDTVKFAGAAEEQAYKGYRSEVDSRVSAYDKRTQQLRENGKTARADKRDANRSSNEYVQIQGELSSLETSESVFRVRMGENVTRSYGGGNIWYNSGTKEIDVNLSNYGDFTNTQKLAHELTHGFQFLNQDIDFRNNGKPGLLYDQTDEIAAFQRQNLFLQAGQSAVDPYSTVRSSPDYKGLPSGPISFLLYSQVEQGQYRLYNKAAFHNGKPPALIYPGWKNDYK